MHPMEIMTCTPAAENGTRDHEVEMPRGAGPAPSPHRVKNRFPLTEEIPQRICEIAMWRGLGYSFREIGEKFGISPQAVSLMLSRHHRAVKSLRNNPQLHGLSARAVNVLGRYSIRTRDEAHARHILAVLPRERNCGRKTIEEIQHWLESESASHGRLTT